MSAGDLTTDRPLHDLTLGDVSRSNARRFAGRTALVDGPLRLSFAELDTAAARAAARFAAGGVGRNAVVAWLGRNHAALVVALLAAARRGAALAPLHWRLRSAEAQAQLDQLQPAAVVAGDLDDPEVTAAARALCAGTPWWTAGELLAGGDGPAEDDAPGVSEDSPLLCLFTAAFDGRPRAAELSHRAVLTQALLLAARDHLDPTCAYLASGPLAHIGALQYVLAHWLVGARVVVLDRMDPDRFVAAVAAERITGAFVVPASVPGLVAAAQRSGADLSSLRTPALAGTPAFERWTELTARPVGAGGGTGTSSGYGQTEVAGLVTSVAVGPGRPAGPAGWPQHAAVVRIVRPGTGQEAAVGEPGELVVRGPLVMRGYRGDPAATRARRGGGWHHTGDLARAEEDGSITFLGPLGDMVKSGGENVYCAEVEAALRDHPGIADAAVVGAPDAVWGEVVAAVLQPAPGREPAVADIEAWLTPRIAGFKRPRRWRWAAELPRRPDGRPDRDTMRGWFTAPEYNR